MSGNNETLSNREAGSMTETSPSSGSSEATQSHPTMTLADHLNNEKSHDEAAEQPTSQPEQAPQQPPQHPRKDLANWKWMGTIAVIYLTSIINGYDVSNVANIQPRLYEEFGNIKLLPWIGLSYSLAFFACQSLSRKIILCFDLRWIYLCNLVIFIAGAAVSGSAQNFASVIVGRVVMGLAGCHVQTTNMSYLAVLATPAETPGLFAGMSASWAVGLVVGGPIGSALSENSATTWRWAFYMNIPWVGLGLLIALLCAPKRSFAPPVPLLKCLTMIDPIGIALNIASPVLLGIGLTFCGPIWAWDSGAAIAVWVVFALVTIFWFVQQYFCILTTRDQRAMPLHILPRTDLLPIWIASGCSGSTYAVTLYYTPLYFAFTQGYDALEQTVRMLPFILVFIVIVLTTGASLPVIGRYNIIYILGGAATLAAGTALAATLDATTSDARVMGLTALIGIGLGMHFQHGMGISNVINKSNQRDRLDSVVICNMSQMGAIAIMLAAAGSIFQNVGYDLLVDAVGTDQYDETEIREALAGVSSVVWQTRDPAVLRRGVAAVAEVLAREFYIVTAGGALCLVCGMLMKWEKLDYGRPKKADKGKKEEQHDASESA